MILSITLKLFKCVSLKEQNKRIDVKKAKMLRPTSGPIIGCVYQPRLVVIHFAWSGITAINVSEMSRINQ